MNLELAVFQQLARKWKWSGNPNPYPHTSGLGYEGHLQALPVLHSVMVLQAQVTMLAVQTH